MDFHFVSNQRTSEEKKTALLLVIFFHTILLIIVLESTPRHSKQILKRVIYIYVMAIIRAICHGTGKTLIIYACLKKLVEITSVVIPRSIILMKGDYFYKG
jgi:hypothetical protein